MATYSMADLTTTGAMAILGVFMKRYGWPRPPILIAVALGKILEKYLVISLAAFGFKMFYRPPVLVICALMMLVIIWGLRIQKRAATAKEETTDVGDDVTTEKTAPSDNSPVKNITTIGVRRWFSVEFVGEVTLLGLTGAFFGYMFVDTMAMPLGAKVLPWIAVGIGTPFLLFRVANLFRWNGVTSSEDIMDTGFLAGADPKEELLGFIRISLFIAALYLGIWLFGFLVAVPIGVFLYLLIYGRAGWFWSVFAGMAFATLILGVFDWTLNVPWHEPLISFLP